MSEFPQIPGYKISKILGKGGMGIVYLAVQEALDRKVALKVTLPSLYDEDKTFLDRFVREAKSSAMLQHPNIITVFDAGVFENSSYMAMEYVPTGTLSDLKKEDLSHNQICRLFIGIAKGLSVAHDAGLVHRDIKPDNILIDTDGSPLVTDFGIVKTLHANNQTLTRVGDTVGTPQYMSPEQIKAETLDGRSDLYSLGIVLYNFLEGHVPFADTTPSAVYIKHVTEEPEPLSKENEDFQPVIIKALQKSPDDRFSNAQEFVRALESLMQLPHTPAPKKALSQSEISRARTKMVPPVTEIPLTNDNNVMKIGLAAGVLVILLGGYWLFTRFSSSDPVEVEKQELVQNVPKETVEKVKVKEVKLPKKTIEDEKPKIVSVQVNTANNEGVGGQQIAEKGLDNAIEVGLEKDLLDQGEEASSPIAVETTNDIAQVDSIDEKAKEEVNGNDENTSVVDSVDTSKSEGFTDIDVAERTERPLNEKVKQLLLAADEDYAKLRLLRPSQDNAYTKYSAVLQIDSQNNEAKIGLLNIIRKYVALMQAKLKGDKFSEAQNYINDAIKLRQDYDDSGYGVGNTLWQDAAVTLPKLQQEKNKIDFRIQELKEQRRLAQQAVEKKKEVVVEKPNFEKIYLDAMSYLDSENYSLAKENFEKAAEQGHAPSQNELGTLYLKARGVEKNYDQALKWFTKAAKQNYVKAQDNLGLMYFKGYGTKRSYDESFFWYSKAANQGYADSQGILGAMYEYGRGVKKNSYIGVQWYKKAAKQGNKFAIKKLRKRGISKYD